MRAYPLPSAPADGINDPPGKRIIAGFDEIVRRSLTADIMARAREIVLVMGREDNSPVRVRCGGARVGQLRYTSWPPRRWRCWRRSPGRTWRPPRDRTALMGGGGSPTRSPRTG